MLVQDDSTQKCAYSKVASTNFFHSFCESSHSTAKKLKETSTESTVNVPQMSRVVVVVLHLHRIQPLSKLLAILGRISVAKRRSHHEQQCFVLD